MTSGICVKSDRLKSKLQQIFVACWFQFCAEVALFIIIYCSVQIIYKKMKYILQSMSYLPDFPGDILGI